MRARTNDEIMPVWCRQTGEINQVRSFATLNVTVLAAIPSASEMVATAMTTGAFSNRRSEYLG